MGSIRARSTRGGLGFVKEFQVVPVDVKLVGSSSEERSQTSDF